MCRSSRVLKLQHVLWLQFNEISAHLYFIMLWLRSYIIKDKLVSSRVKNSHWYFTFKYYRGLKKSLNAKAVELEMQDSKAASLTLNAWAFIYFCLCGLVRCHIWPVTFWRALPISSEVYLIPGLIEFNHHNDSAEEKDERTSIQILDFWVESSSPFVRYIDAIQFNLMGSFIRVDFENHGVHLSSPMFTVLHKWPSW